MNVIKIGFGDWSENFCEIVDMSVLNADSVKEHLIECSDMTELLECHDLESVDDVEIDVIEEQNFVVYVDEGMFSEFGFIFFNLDKMLELNESGKMVKLVNRKVTIVNETELTELDMEWNDTEYSVLSENNCYKIVKAGILSEVDSDEE